MLLSRVLFGLLAFFSLPLVPTVNATIDECTTNINKYNGECLSPSSCTGGIYNNLCPGSKKCCVPDPEWSPWFYTKYVSKDEFKSIFSSVSSARSDALYPWFNSALEDILKDKMGNSECNIISAFSAQIGHESGNLMLFEELASGADYEGRCKTLGNCNTGDGVKYKGRGAIQITGRKNYQSLSTSAGTDFISKPELLVFPSHGFEASVWYWISNGLNKFCTGKTTDFFELTRRINGGLNGIEDRLNKWYNAKTVMKC